MCFSRQPRRRIQPNPPQRIGYNSRRLGHHRGAALSERLVTELGRIVDALQKSASPVDSEKLQAIGTIPMTSTNALAARTAREKRPELVNNFTAARHASVFEGVPLGRRHGELIHKIMSAPVTIENKVVGVVQISRKGRTATDAGPDFTQKDLRDLVSLTAVLGRFIKTCQGS